MKFLEKIAIVSLCVAASAALVACDVSSSDEAAGGSGGAGGSTGDAGPIGGAGGMGGSPGTTFNTVLIKDTTAEENMAGTPGVDICGITAMCNGTEISPVSADLVAEHFGTGDICSGPDSPAGIGCSTDRSDPALAADDGATCEAASNPSDYVSIGLDGWLTVTFDQDLAGCDLTIVELSGGAQTESYTVDVCDEALDTCTTAPIATVDMGGTADVSVPATLP